MDYTIILVYCLCDDTLRALYHQEDPHCTTSNTEVIITGLVAALILVLWNLNNLVFVGAYPCGRPWAPASGCPYDNTEKLRLQSI
jgi:hypothetical protein